MKIPRHRKVIVSAAALAFTATQFLSAADPPSMSLSAQGHAISYSSVNGAVKDKGMKVERKNGTIVVTLPKA